MARRRVAVEFVAELTQFRRGTRDGAADVRKLKHEATAAQVEVGKLGRVGKQAGADLRAGLHRGVDGALRDAGGRYAKSGEQAGKGYGDGFKRGAAVSLAGFVGGAAGAFGDLGRAAPKSAALSLAAIPASAAAAAASLQTIPPVLAAIGGGLGALPALAVGAAGSLGTLKLATAGIGDAIGEVFAAPDGSDPYDRLSRSGKRFVDVLASQRNALLGLQRIGQDRVFAGLDAEATALAGVALPFAERQVIRFGDTWNDTFRQVARVGRDPQFLASLDVAFESADRFFDGVNARIPGTSRSLSQLFTSSQPFVDAFGSSLLSYVDDFNAWIDTAASNGDLAEFFRDAGQQADALLDVGKEVFVLVGRIGGIQSDSTLLRDMADALARFNDEAHSMRSVQGIIETGNAAIEGMVKVLAVVGETLGETLANPATKDAVVAFFNVLTAAATVVGGLVTAFGSLWGPLQSVILTGAALALLWGKLQGAGGRLSEALGRVNTRLAEAGPVGARAADGFGRAERAIGRLGIALVAAQVGSAALGSTMNPQVDALAVKLGQFAESGTVAGEAARIFGDDLGKLDTALKDIADTGAWSSFGRGFGGFVEGLSGAGDVFDDSLKKSRERLQSLDQALTDMVSSGNAQAAADAFQKVAERAAEQGVSVAELNAVLPGYAAAVEAAAAKGDAYAATVAQAAVEQQLLKGSMDSAITTMQSYSRVWQELNGVQLNSDQAMLAANESIKAVAESFKENGKAIKGNSTAALENRIAVGEAGQAAADAAQKKYEETGSIKEANGVYDTYIGKLRQTLDQAGLTDKEIDTLIATYASLPDSKFTRIIAETAQANANLTAIKKLSDAIQSKRVVITTVHNTIVTRSEGRNVGIGDGIGGRRWGGIDYAMAEGGSIEAHFATSPTILFGERETGAEAFIPLRGDRERSISIGRRAMEWFGMDVVPRGQTRSVPMSMAGGGGGNSQPTYTGPQVLEAHIEIGGEVVRVARTEIKSWARNLKREVEAGAGQSRV